MKNISCWIEDRLIYLNYMLEEKIDTNVEYICVIKIENTIRNSWVQTTLPVGNKLDRYIDVVSTSREGFYV